MGRLPEDFLVNRFVAFVARHRLPIGVLFSSFCGAILAAGARPALQDPVESGQVLAGIVKYPSYNPFYVYHVKLWTLFNQGAAVLLKAGVSEFSASLLIEGLVGAVSFAAIFLLVYAISGKSVVALFTPLFVHLLNLVGISIAYPIRLLGTAHTYGIFGLTYAVLVIGVLGVGRYRTGAFLSGLAPAFHPSLGAFCVLLSGSAVFVNRRELKPELASMLWYFIAGSLLTAASLVWQLHFFPPEAAMDPALKKKYLDAFIQNFDYHRSFDGWRHGGFLTGLLASAVAIMASRGRRAPVGARIVFSAITASVVATIGIAFFAEFVPFFDFLKILIPWRFMNFANLCLVPVALGFLAADFPRMPRLRTALFFLVLILCFLWQRGGFPDIEFLYIGIAFFVLLVAAISLPDIPAFPFRYLLKWRERAVAAAVGVVVVIHVLPAAASLVSRDAGTIPEIYGIASGRPGMLLTAGDMPLIQLMTGRPLLMDSGLDFFAYVPETGPRFNEILKKVYGLDLFIPPPGEQRNAGKLTFSHRDLWEGRTMDEWRAIRKEFGVTDILTPADWRLQLPLIADDGDRSLFTIP